MSVRGVRGRDRAPIEVKELKADYGEMIGLGTESKRPHVKNGSFREWELGGPGDGGMKPDLLRVRSPGRTSV